MLRVPDVGLELIIHRLPHHTLQTVDTSHAYPGGKRVTKSRNQFNASKKRKLYLVNLILVTFCPWCAGNVLFRLFKRVISVFRKWNKKNLKNEITLTDDFTLGVKVLSTAAKVYKKIFLMQCKNSSLYLGPLTWYGCRGPQSQSGTSHWSVTQRSHSCGGTTACPPLCWQTLQTDGLKNIKHV